jgi:3-oxoacyl-[acyl-carrier protein] reductase
MEEELSGRVALVTGASGGIGAAIAGRLAAAGAAVAVGYGHHPEPARALAGRIGAAGGRAVAVGGDLADPDAPGRLVDEAERALGPVEVLVANAGMGRRRTLDDLSADEWELTLAVNLRAPLLLLKRCVPGMRERGWGRVLLMSSVAAFTGGLVGPHYAASKAGLHGLLHFVAAREAANGITVNAIAPALIEETAMLPGDPGDLAARIPVGRLGRPAEVAGLALAVLSNGYLTDQVIGLDGGMHPR